MPATARPNMAVTAIASVSRSEASFTTMSATTAAASA
jgi:hypothetical protein